MVHGSDQRRGSIRKTWRPAAGLLVLLSALTTAACALERVELRNGFSYDCARREILADGQVRLFLLENSMVSGEATNFVDLPAASILKVEHTPDPPLIMNQDSPVAATSAGSALEIQPLLVHAGSAHHIDAELLASIVRAESGGHADALSRTGARGLMQLMPGTAREMNVANSSEPEANINGGTAYLDRLLVRYHDNLALALAAYNAGPAAVDRFHGVPPFRETRQYVVRVMTEFKRRKAALERSATAPAKNPAAAIALVLR